MCVLESVPNNPTIIININCCTNYQLEFSNINHKLRQKTFLSFVFQEARGLSQLSVENFQFKNKNKKKRYFPKGKLFIHYRQKKKKKIYIYLCVLCVVVLLSAPISCRLCGLGTRVAATIGVVDSRGTIGIFNKIEKVQIQYKYRY